MNSKKAKKAIAKMIKKAKNPFGIKNNLEKNSFKNKAKMTWPEKEFEKILIELDIKFEKQKIVGNKIFDFFIPNKNLLIEVDGTYWHGFSEKFKNPNRIQKKNIKNDKFKNALANGHGYSLERIWEHDLKTNYEEVKNRIITILN